MNIMMDECSTDFYSLYRHAKRTKQTWASKLSFHLSNVWRHPFIRTHPNTASKDAYM